MKKIIFALAMICLICSTSFASTLMSEGPFGAGKIVLAGALIGDYSYASSSPLYGLGGLIGYAITNELALFGTLGYATEVNLPAGTDYVNALSVGGSLKYTLLKEGGSIPVGVSGAISYSTGTATASYNNGLVTGQSVAGNLGVKIAVSKVIAHFAPFVALELHSVDTKTPASSSTKTKNWVFSLGSYMFLSKTSGVVGQWSTIMQSEKQPSTAILIGYFIIL